MEHPKITMHPQMGDSIDDFCLSAARLYRSVLRRLSTLVSADDCHAERVLERWANNDGNSPFDANTWYGYRVEQDALGYGRPIWKWRFGTRVFCDTELEFDPENIPFMGGSHVAEDDETTVFALRTMFEMPIGSVVEFRVGELAPEPGISFDFNDTTVEHHGPWPTRDGKELTVDEFADALLEQWNAKQKAARDAYWTPERKAAHEKEAAAHARKMEARRERIAAAHASWPFEPKEGKADDYAEYRATNLSDGYSNAVVRFSEAWAALMSEQIAAGKSVAEAAEATEFEADTEGITGFMYGCAVRALATFWIHGEELRRWHNSQYGKDGEAANAGDGVINPAVLTVSRT